MCEEEGGEGGRRGEGRVGNNNSGYILKRESKSYQLRGNKSNGQREAVESLCETFKKCKIGVPGWLGPFSLCLWLWS